MVNNTVEPVTAEMVALLPPRLRFRTKLEAHIERKEVALFAFIQRLEVGVSDHRSIPRNSFGPLSHALFFMHENHDFENNLLRMLADISNGFACMPDAPSSYRDLMTHLQALKLDLDEHVGKEDDLLFPEAIRLETSCVLANKGGNIMTRTYVLGLALSLALATVPLLAQNPTSHAATPPSNFKKVSTIVNLPDWLPGLGTLYIDPATAPLGPYLGYNHNGRLVNVIYMISIKDFDQHKDLNDLGQKVARMGLKVDHTSVDYNPGHPGMQEPHYHVIEWLITPAQQEQEMK